MAAKRYDPQCELLARYFLPSKPDEATVVELAGVIQEAIENWEENRPKEKADATDDRKRNLKS